MRLDRLKIEEEIKSPSKGVEIRMALEQQERIKFHADTNLDSTRNSCLRTFKDFVASILPKDKTEITMNLLKFPIPTNSVTEKVFVKLSKIFEGRNPAFNYQFHDPKDEADWENYRHAYLDEPEVWSNKAWEFFKTEINSVMVVDMPADGSEDKPEPYFYFVPISSVISYSTIDDMGGMEWIIFRNGDKVIVIDGESYRTYPYNEREGLGRKISDNPHTLGYCPARFFWTEPLSLKNPDVKRSPLSKELSNLDWYLFKLLGKRHLETYASYPIYSGFEEECEYTDKEGNTCNHGYLQTPEGTFLTDVNGQPMICPICHGKKELAGPGSYITVPVPEENQPDLRNPISILSIDKDSLKYNKDECESLKKQIIDSCVGVDNTIINELSVTDKQVDATYESQDAVLNRVKKGFEMAQMWVDGTICRLRYGSSFMSVKINYGTEFYTLTPEVLQKRYNDAKKGGASESELDALRQQMLETEYRHNPIMLQRMLILSDLEPFRHSTREEVMNLYDKGLITKEELRMKVDFSSFIRRFERENDNIIEFASEKPYFDKISTIKNSLLDYAREGNQNPSQRELQSSKG